MSHILSSTYAPLSYNKVDVACCAECIPLYYYRYSHTETMAQQSLCEWCSLHDLNTSLHDLDKGKPLLPRVVSYYCSLEHVLVSMGYKSSFTKNLLYQRKETESLTVQLFYLTESSRIIFSLCLGLFFAMPSLAWRQASFWQTDGACLKWWVLKYHWYLWDHLLAHVKKKKINWRKINTWFSTAKVKSQELTQEWVDLDWRSIQSRALTLTVPIVPQR